MPINPQLLEAIIQGWRQAAKVANKGLGLRLLRQYLTLKFPYNAFPLIYYHGSRAGIPFTVFDKSKFLSEHNTGVNGFWFGDDFNLIANLYGHLGYPNGITMPVFLFGTNPYMRTLQGLRTVDIPELDMKGVTVGTDGVDSFSKILKDLRANFQLPMYDSAILRGIDSSQDEPFYESLLNLFVVKEPNQIKSANPFTYDANGNLIDITQRFDEENPDINYFKDSYGREVESTPYPGDPEDLKSAVELAQVDVLRTYFSPDKINQIKSTMGWEDSEIAELLDEILRSIGEKTDVKIKSPKDGFLHIGQHDGDVTGTGENAIGHHVVTLNSERIPDIKTAIEAGYHEIGLHGKTLGIKPEHLGQDTFSEKIHTWFPRLTELCQKNLELANEILEFNAEGRFWSLFDTPEDIAEYILDNKISRLYFAELYKKWKYFKYRTRSDESAARGLTLQLYEKFHPEDQSPTKNYELLLDYYTPESAAKFSKAVLNFIPPALLIPWILQQNNKNN